VHLGALLLLLVAVVPAAAFSGSFAGVDGPFWEGVTSTIIRGALASGLVAIASASLALITRTTASAVGIMLGYGVIGMSLVFWLLASFAHIEIAMNSTAFITGSDVARILDGRFGVQVFSHGPWLAGLVSLAYTAIIVVVATLLFTRRDID
jgi:hypothetical protein